MSVLIFEVIVFGLSIPVMILISDVPPRWPPVSEAGPRCSPLVAAGLLRRPAATTSAGPSSPSASLLGFLTTPMFIVGGMFLGLWVLSFVLGKRLDNRPESPAPA